LAYELVTKSVILSPALAVSQAKALRNRVFKVTVPKSDILELPHIFPIAAIFL
jgi:hypothetical protein